VYHASVRVIVVGDTSMDIKDIITLVIAIYGAGLSTYILYKQRRHISIAIQPDFHVYANGSISTQMVSIKAVNLGARDVKLTFPTIRLPNGKFLSFTNVSGMNEFSKRLADGDTASLSMSMQKLSNSLKSTGLKGKVKIRPCCYDSAGKQYLGKRFKVDLAKKWEEG
jgi:hypothetical protein